MLVVTELQTHTPTSHVHGFSFSESIMEGNEKKTKNNDTDERENMCDDSKETTSVLMDVEVTFLGD